MSIIERILQIMDSKHLNQTELCKILGIKDSTFSSWKTRGTDPPAKYLVLICEFLGVSVDYLLGRTEEPEKIRNTQNNTNGNNNISINKTESAISEIGQEMLKILESLPTRERINLLKMAYDYQEEYTKK